ncbi:MAG: hypothetical protein EXQ55_05125 [Acidobacteria bacterium]|nr:hypothetical protein [Acidobacteriota bacterium]
MKLIIVDRKKPEMYERLKRQFAEDLNVEVVWERRSRERRRMTGSRGPERRSISSPGWPTSNGPIGPAVLQRASPSLPPRGSHRPMAARLTRIRTDSGGCALALSLKT